MADVSKLQGLFREDAASLMEYHPVKPLDVLAVEIGLPVQELVKLDANENLYGPHPAVQQAVADAHGVAHIYPDPMQGHLLDRLTSYTGRSRDEIVCGAGADELIDLALRVVMPEKIVISPPTFAMYKFFALVGRAETVEVPLVRLGDSGAFQADADAVIASIREHGAKVVMVTSPNNPTGLCVPLGEIERICAENVLVVVDEAYWEFAPEGSSAAPLLDKYSNLVILRTFSKWAGLAGMRVGYLLGHPAFVAKVRQIKIPYNVSVVAEAAACCALDNRESVHKTVQLLNQERTRVMSYLSVLGFLKPLPSDSNFTLCEVAQDAGISAKELHAKLRAKGILLRYYPDLGRFGEFMRISFGRPEDTDKMMAAFVEEIAEEKRAQMIPFKHASNLATALLWDMDGVLADVSQSYRTAILQTAKHYGVEATGEDVNAMKLKGDANNDWVLTRRIIEEKKNGSTPSLEEVTATFQGFYLGGLRDKEQLLTPVERLRELAQRVPMAVVTGRPREEAEYFLKLHGISDLFSPVVCMEDGPPKPNPAPVLKAMEGLAPRLGAGRQTFFMIGDTVDDVRAAVAAHAQTDDDRIVLGLGILAPGHGTLQSNEKEVGALFSEGSLRVFDSSANLLDFLASGTISAGSDVTTRPGTQYPQ